MIDSLYGFELLQYEVHVWSAGLEQPAQLVEQFYGLLSNDEQDRAGRYHFEHLRQSFVVTRGLLRLLLASYTGLQPRHLEFTYPGAGKPQLSEKHGRTVFFNLSHSHELVFYAFSSTLNVGIDIEYIRPIEDLGRIAEHNFSPYEIAELKMLAPENMLAGFFNCWTRKEAFIKAIGDGISFPLQEFDVSLKPGEPAKLLSIHGSGQEASHWSMVELYPADNYVAALVVEGNVRNVIQREWNGLDNLMNGKEPK